MVIGNSKLMKLMTVSKRKKNAQKYLYTKYKDFFRVPEAYAQILRKQIKKDFFMESTMST